MITVRNMTFRRSSFFSRITSWFERFRDRAFRKKLKIERSKKYLYQKGETPHSWIHFYNKARRGAYFRPMYSAYTKNELNFKVAFWILWVVLISMSSYIFLESEYFQLSPNRVIIERADEYSDINIAYKAIEPLYGSQLWFMDRQDLRNRISELEKNLDTIEVSLLFPNSLKIIIKTSPPEFTVDFPWVWKSYLLSQNGILIPNRNKEIDFPRLQIYSSELLESSFLDYKEAVDPGIMTKIHNISRVFSVDFNQSVITSEVYYRTENELHLLLENGTRIMFALDSSVEKQLLSLKLAMEQTHGLLSSPENIYIDSRIVGKVFICKVADLCKKNLIKIYGNPPF